MSWPISNITMVKCKICPDIIWRNYVATYFEFNRYILSVLWLVEITCISRHNCVLLCSMSRVLTQTVNHSVWRCHPCMKTSPLPQYPTRYPSQDPTKPQSLDQWPKMSYRSNIWQAPRQQYYCGACQIQSDVTIQTTNPTAPRPHEITRQDVPMDTKLGPGSSPSNGQRGDSPIGNNDFAFVKQGSWRKNILMHREIHMQYAVSMKCG